jgi:EAL domain-containing protein (putative c-di-GMP-specific phosphodiesterase class I)
LFPQDGQFADQIQSNLTYALSTAKQSNTKDVVFYTNELFEQRNRITRLTDALRDSIVNNFEGFRLVMQPIIDAKTEKVYSAEALLRWSNDEFQNVSPMEFIPILEQTGDIIPVGKWILDRALKYLAEWNKINAHNKLNHININFSYIQFTDESLKNYIIDELNKYELPHNSLIIELTESCRIEYTDKLAHLLQNFRDDGITIALDDFGTGYASLRLLRDLPADIVKIDHTMMRTIVNTPRDRTLVEFIITYCSKMNIEVCAEGVETGETLKIVKSADAKYIQGYYYDKPLETDEFFNKYIA